MGKKMLIPGIMGFLRKRETGDGEDCLLFL